MYIEKQPRSVDITIDIMLYAFEQRRGIENWLSDYRHGIPLYGLPTIDLGRYRSLLVVLDESTNSTERSTTIVNMWKQEFPRPSQLN